MNRKAYIAKYPRPDEEIILAMDSYWSPELRAKFDEIVRAMSPEDKTLIQAWYSDDYQVVCMASL